MAKRTASANTLSLARSISLLCVLVIGVPWTLLVAARARFGGDAPWHGVPSPGSWDIDRIRSALTNRLTDDTIADVVVRLSLAAVWTALIVFVLSVVAEVAHMIRHDGLSMPDIRGLRFTQRTARVIAAGLLVLTPLLSSSRVIANAGAGLLPLQRVSTTLAAKPTGVSPDRSQLAVDRIDHPRLGNAPRERVVRPEESGLRSEEYVVRAGDSIFGIAERIVGSDPSAVAAYADQILDLNLGNRMIDGQRFMNAALIDVGWVLQMPGSSATPSSADLSGGAGQHVGREVERGESLWSIAGDELGAGDRWPEIFVINEGRTFDDGRTLSDPNLIQPGWTLDIPGDVAVEPPQVDASIVASIDDVVPDVASPIEASSIEMPVASVLPIVSPNLAEPPGIDTPTEAETTGGEQGHRPVNEWVSQDPPPDAVAGNEMSAANEYELLESGDAATLAFGGSAMLSSGLLTLLAVRRRNRLRRARPRTRIPGPTLSASATERALRAIHPGERLARIDVAIRSVAGAAIEHGRRVLAVLSAGDGAVELIFTGPVDLGQPWEGAGSRWVLPVSTPLEMLVEQARQVGSTCPTLMQLGRTEDERDVYVDLEALGALEIGGPGAHADAIVAAVAATLASSVFAEATTLIGLGVPDHAFLGHRLYVPARDLVSAFGAATEAVGSLASMSSSTFELRARRTSGETWEPAVVLIGASMGTVVPSALRNGIVTVSASPISGPSSRLVPERNAWMLQPAGIRLHPVGLTDDDLSEIADLVDLSDPHIAPELGGVDRADSEVGDAEVVDDLTIHADEADTEAEGDGPEWDLLVRLIGPVDVMSASGVPVEFERSKTKELVAWLATHRDRATRTSARTALWELDVRDATFSNVVSEARRSLARLVEPPVGAEWVGRTLTESLPLHDRVLTDADLIEHALDVARLQPPAQAIATLTPAVEWIAGTPFEGTSYLWPDAEGISSNLVLLAISAASELAAHCLSVGDIEGVFAATGRGLNVLPGHEELIALRMRAYARSGDHAGVRQEWESYERVITADPWSDGEPSPKLVDLRKELLNPSR